MVLSGPTPEAVALLSAPTLWSAGRVCAAHYNRQLCPDGTSKPKESPTGVKKNVVAPPSAPRSDPPHGLTLVERLFGFAEHDHVVGGKPIVSPFPSNFARSSLS